jgi:hypothetical protein
MPLYVRSQTLLDGILLACTISDMKRNKVGGILANVISKQFRLYTRSG